VIVVTLSAFLDAMVYPRQNARIINPALAHPVGAKEYVDREWSREAISRR